MNQRLKSIFQDTELASSIALELRKDLTNNSTKEQRTLIPLLRMAIRILDLRKKSYLEVKPRLIE